MVTTNVETWETFTVGISQRNDGTIRVEILNEKGERRLYSFNQTKLAFFVATNAAIRDATEFLLGDA